MEERRDLVARKQFSAEEIAAIKATIAHNLTSEELALFFATCMRTGLDAISRQIYCTVSEWTDKRGNHQRKINIQATVDGFRVIAERSGKYAGQVGPFWCGNDGQWQDVWLMKDPPRASKVGILRQDFKEPIWAVAIYESYKQDYSPVWNKMPEQMLAKCAESLALRKAFPNDLSGLYTDSEMAQSEERTVEQKKEVKNFAPTVEQLKAPKEEIVITEKDEAVPSGRSIGEIYKMWDTLNMWKIPFGRKYIGKSMLDIGYKQAKEYGEWLKSESDKSGKPPSPGAQKYQEMLELYSVYLEEKEIENQSKIHSPAPSSIDIADEIPF